MRALAHVQPALDVDARLDESVDLVEQRVGIEHDAVADRAAHAGMQDPARDLMQHEGAVAEVDGVPGVRASLIAHHPVGPLGEHVHELPFPFVPPLRADDDDDARFRTIEAELRLELVAGAGRHELAVVDDRDDVGEAVGFVEVLGGEEHVGAARH